LFGKKHKSIKWGGISLAAALALLSALNTVNILLIADVVTSGWQTPTT